MNKQKTNTLSIIILLWGLSAMVTHFTGDRIKALKGLALASCTAPYPKVFCLAQTFDQNHYFEPFTSSFVLNYCSQGTQRTLLLTPEIYQKIQGPYNRRNVFGALLAYGPSLNPKLQREALHYALIDPAPLAHDLGLPKDAYEFSLQITNKEKTWVLHPLPPSKL